MDIRLALMCGTDIPIPECQLIIHQPRIKEIALIGEKDFFLAMQCLCINKTMFAKDEVVLDNINNFQIFMTIMNEKEAIDKKNAVKSLLSIMMPEYQIFFTPQSFLCRTDERTIMIDESNFNFFQDICKQIFCFSSLMGGSSGFNPANEKAREIAEKLLRGRQIVAEQNGETNNSILSQYLSSLTIGLNSMSLNECINLTLYQLYDLIERYQLYINWDIDIRSRLAGAKVDKKPENWMKNIH